MAGFISNTVLLVDADNAGMIWTSVLQQRLTQSLLLVRAREQGIRHTGKFFYFTLASEGCTMKILRILLAAAFVAAGLLMLAATGDSPRFRNTLSTIPPNPDPAPIPQGQFFTAPLITQIPVAKPFSCDHGERSYYKITMRAGTWKFHPTLPPTNTLGYDDNKGGYIGYLGPSIETRKNELVSVLWSNDLPSTPESPFGLSDPLLVPPDLRNTWGRAVVHVHGGHNPTEYDGGPEHWILPGTSTTYHYSNIADACMVWYHDHALGVTRTNAYAGLAALYFIRDKVEDKLNIPKGKYEVPLVIQDKAFYWEGGSPQLWYPNPWIPEMFGNCMVVNAQLWPVMQVERRRYRLRMLNASQAAFLNLRISDPFGATWPVDPATNIQVPNSVLPFWVIGMEGGFISKAVRKDALLLGNAERCDVIVDFTNVPTGTVLYLTNNAAQPFEPAAPPLNYNDVGPYGDPNSNIMLVMKFVVVDRVGKDKTMTMPASIEKVDRLKPSKVKVYRQITLNEAPYENDPNFMKVLINNRPFVANLPGADPLITETPKLGETEIWQFVNLTPDTHPIHLHHSFYQVLDRTPLAIDQNGDYLYALANGGSPISATGKIPAKYLAGPAVPADPEEGGFKDTAKMNPGEVTRIIVKFTEFRGPFVYHCHILEHEENDMMQYMLVGGKLDKEAAEAAEAMPDEYALDQNYPNPFNPSTTIRFQIPVNTHVRLTVFDNLGREVTKLMNQDLTAGAHTVNWNPQDQPSGVYHCRLEAGIFVTTKSMVLVK